MKKIAKYVFIGIIGVSCFSIFFFSYSFLLSFQPLNNNATDGNESSKNFQVEGITLIVDYAGVLNVKIIENFSLTNYETTVFDALLKYCDLGYKEYPGGAVYIEEIDGVRNDVSLKNHFWLYYVNDDYVGLGASHNKLNNGDLVNWTYSKLN